MVRVPLRDPLADGSKNTPIEQLDPAAKDPPHALRTPKSEALVFTLAIVNVAPPVFVAVMVCGRPDVPTYWPGNIKLAGDSVSSGAGVVVPVIVRDCGLPGALSLTARVALRVPCAVGVNVMLTWQDALAASVAPQLVVSA
jgi:hypothetical protein